MADNTTKRKLQAQGLLYLASGGTMAELDNPDFADMYINDFSMLYDNNFDVERIPSAELDSDPADFVPPQPEGIKDYLEGLITKQLETGESDPDAVLAIKSAMVTAGYQDIDLESDTFSEDENKELARFNTSIANDSVKLETIVDENKAIADAEAAAAAADLKRIQDEELAREQAAAAEAATKAKLSSMLVYGGYLPVELADDPNAIVNALRTVVSTHEDAGNLEGEYGKIFTDTTGWAFKEGGEGAAVDYLSRTLAGISPQEGNEDRLRADLESGDKDRIELAQGYLAVTHPEVAITGTLDRVTYDEGLEALKAPITIPEGMFNEDGTLNSRDVLDMAVRGQLYLPIEALTPEERAELDALDLPLAADREEGQFYSQERYIAMKLIAEDPERYLELIKEENARRATATLDAEFVDLDAASKENVVAVVTDVEAATAAVDLPPNLAETAVAFAAKNGGTIEMSMIPNIISLAVSNGSVELGNDRSIALAEDTLTALGMDNFEAQQEFLRLSVNLDPSSPTFTQDMKTFLEHAYVMHNAHNTGADGKTTQLDTIPADVDAKLTEIAAGQATVVVADTSKLTEELGLPSNTIPALFNASSDGVLRLEDMTRALLDTNDPRYMSKLDRDDPVTMLYRSNIYEDGPQKETLQRIINTGVLDLKDPAQLSVALQIAITMKDGEYLENVAGNPNITAATDALAQGYLGTNAGKPDVTPPATTTPTAETGQEMSSLTGSFTVALNKVWGGYGPATAPLTPDDRKVDRTAGFDIG